MTPIKQHIIDAKGQKLGRVATEAAHILMGKNLVTFVKNKRPLVTVKIVNASKISISEKHLEHNTYARFSGYQGGLRFETLGALIKRRGYKEALRHAVRGMMPNNKLRPRALKNLSIVD